METSNNFKLSRYTIRFKLTFVIVFITVLSLGSMTFLASFFFGSESTLRIQEYNLGIAQSLGRQVESEIETISSKGLVISKLLNKNQNKSLGNELFQKDENFIYLSLYDISDIKAENKINTKNYLLNETFIKNNKLSKNILDKIISENLDSLKLSITKEIVLFNASTKTIPIIALSTKDSEDKIIVIFFNPEKLFNAFSSESIATTFMVDNLGNIIAHQNSNLLLSRINLSRNPIINSMFKSQVRAGQLRYKDVDKQNYLGSYYQLGISNLGIIAYVGENLVFSPVKKLQNRNILILIIVLISAVGIAYFFAKTLTTPVKSLMYATDLIVKGKYDLEILPAYRDEVGSLTNSFGQMAKGLGEREKIKDAFGRFVNKEIAEQVLKGEVKLGGEKKIAAIFFSDLRNFTSMSEKMEPEVVVSFLNDYFTEMVHCVEKTHGVVDKYIGDAIMAHWGAIGNLENATENAINASLMMRNALIKFNIKGVGIRPIASMGCGINTGPVISGQIGSESRLDYTVIGDAVNLASRVEALNKPFKTDILITEESYKFVKDIFLVEQMPSIKVKGKENVQKIYAVIGRKDDPNAFKSLKEIRNLLDIEFEDYTEIEIEQEEVKYKIEK